MRPIPKPIVDILKQNKDKIETHFGNGYVDELLEKGIGGIRKLTQITQIINNPNNKESEV